MEMLFRRAIVLGADLKTNKRNRVEDMNAESVLKNIRTKMVLITPKKAGKWLQSNTKNRDVSEDHVARLADDMTNKKWMITHQGVAFNCDGTLLDGQHRLMAVVKSGTSQWMPVTSGLPVESVSAIDDHRKRSVRDSLKIVHGVHAPNMRRAVAAAAWMAPGIGATGTPTKITRSQQECCYLEHAQALAWAIVAYPTNKSGLGRAVVLAVIARAYYSASKKRLAQFCKVLMDPSASDGRKEDQTIFRLRDFLMTSPSGGSSTQQIAYRKTERALHSWLRGEALSKITESKDELFLCPSERLAKSK